MLAAVDAGQLAELVWVALLAGVATSVLFATLVVGATRATDLRREGRHAAATAAMAVSAVAALGCLAGMAFGIAIILSK
jgi:uncharacterized integral membrane protein